MTFVNKKNHFIYLFIFTEFLVLLIIDNIQILYYRCYKVCNDSYTVYHVCATLFKRTGQKKGLFLMW